MTDQHQPQSQIQVALRAMRGVATSQDLQKQLGISQASVSRALAPLIASGEVLKVGAARSQCYLLPRPVRGVDPVIPIMKVNESGAVSHFGRIIPIHGGRFWLEEVDGPDRAFDGLPWFMSDMRPQGFIGRTFSKAHPELNLVASPERWSDDDVLKALSVMGEDLPGNLIIGQASFDRFHTLAQRREHAQSAAEYPALANRAMQGVSGGSSAGGEQPKFCTIREGRHVIVKFSPDGEAPADRRARDLLICEHLALMTLFDAGYPATESEIFIEAGRVFLEVVRFDRTKAGRIGMVSLMAYDAEYVGEMTDWGSTATTMAARELLTPEDSRHLQFLEAFGRLIGNSDRHYGNISLLIEGDDWVLSPTYDMLPMVYATIAGEVVPVDFLPEDFHPTVDTLEVWEDARALAGKFWATAAADERLTEEFREIAQRHAELDWPQETAEASLQPNAY